MESGVLVQRAMNARFIIIRGIPTQDPAQVRLPKYDHVVETFPSDRTDQSLDIRVLPRRSGSSRLVPNAHGTQPLPQDRAIRSVSVPNKITRWTVPGKRLEFGVTTNPTAEWISRQISTFAFTSPDSHTLLLSSASNWVG